MEKERRKAASVETAKEIAKPVNTERKLIIMKMIENFQRENPFPKLPEERRR